MTTPPLTPPVPDVDEHAAALAQRMAELERSATASAADLLKFALLKLQAEGPRNLQAGICGNVERILEDREGLTSVQSRADQAIVSYLIFNLIEAWPARRSASRVMPIPGYLYHAERKTLWEGDQLTERRALVTHLLDSLNSDQGLTK